MEKVLFILAELDDDDIDWILENATRETIPAGTVLIYERQPIDSVYILLEGELRVLTEAMGDRPLATLHSGEVVGEMSFIDTRPPAATVVAETDALVLSLPRQDLALKLRQDVGFGCRFYRALAVFLSHRLRVTVNQLGEPELNQADSNLLPDSDLASDAQDNVVLAKNRFDWLLRRLKSG